MRISVERLEGEIANITGGYGDAAIKAVKTIIDEVSHKTSDELKASSPKRSKPYPASRNRKPGTYAKDWGVVTEYENARTKRNKVRSKRNYQLTHLLEHGHANRGGGRTAPRPHIEKLEQKAIQELEERIIREVGSGFGI